MTALRTAILVTWAVFWIYWLIAAMGAKEGARTRGNLLPRLIIIVLVVGLTRIFRANNVTVHSAVVEGLGVLLFLSGLGLAVGARIHLGRNWGMPMTEKKEPELVTSGPYRFVRHPIYTGILLAMLGSALAIGLYWLVALVGAGIYFIYSATMEERLLARTFPDSYPAYRARTKMLIPFVL